MTSTGGLCGANPRGTAAQTSAETNDHQYCDGEEIIMTAAVPTDDLDERRSAEARGAKLRGRVAFVTGGTRGIGAAISKSLVSQGATVAAGYGRNSEHAQKFLAELTAASNGAEVSVHHGDVGSADDCRRTIQEVIDLHGRLDILINNAGITIDKTVAKMTADEWNKVIGVNLSGAFFLAQAALAHMLERGSGRIVMVSSVIGETGAIGQANYAASKAGLFGLTKTLAREACFQMGRAGKLTERDNIGVTVNAITPGFVATEMVESVPEKILDRITDSIPMGRLAQPWEVARVVHFLAADASSYITGQVWGVNGGLDM
jgi:acetoacetyl-CoA reductase/3-oxoacyl-[acyl-carrier protein] reductase